MLHFNGPALAAEALRRQREADDPEAPDKTSARHRDAAHTYATLALTAAVLSANWQRIGSGESAEWEAALRVKRVEDGTR